MFGVKQLRGMNCILRHVELCYFLPRKITFRVEGVLIGNMVTDQQIISKIILCIIHEITFSLSQHALLHWRRRGRTLLIKERKASVEKKLTIRHPSIEKLWILLHVEIRPKIQIRSFGLGLVWQRTKPSRFSVYGAARTVRGTPNPIDAEKKPTFCGSVPLSLTADDKDDDGEQTIELELETGLMLSC